MAAIRRSPDPSRWAAVASAVSQSGAVAAEPRLGDSLLRRDHPEAEAALVAQPAVVDLVVVAGEHPLHTLVADREHDVALARAEGADRARVLDVPGPGAEPVGLGGEGADRTELDDVPVERGDVGAVVERADIARSPALEQLQLLVLGDLLAEAHAAVAEDAALAIDAHQRRQRHRLAEVALRVAHPAASRAPAHGDVLQRALPALVADRAVERVVDEQELDHRVLGLLHAVGARIDDHPVADRGRAGGLELRDPLDLHQAHATGADRSAELRLVTEDRDLDVAALRGVDQHLALGSGDLDPVDDQGHLAVLGHATTPVVSGRSIGEASNSPAAGFARRLDRGFELAPELAHHRAHRHRHRVAEHAEAVADDVLLHRGDDVEVHRGRLAAGDPLEHLHGPVRPLAARRALPARLVVVEAGRAQRQVRDRDRVVGDDDRARAQHRAGLGHRLEGVRQVELVLGQHRRRGAAGKPGLHPPALGGAAGEAEDELARRDPQLDLVVARPLHAPGDRDHLGPRRLLGAEALEPVGAVVDDVGEVGERLDVVDQRRAAVEALDGRKRRLQPRVAALALERVEERRLLAADVRAGAAMDDELDLRAGVEDVGPQVVGVVCLGHRPVEHVRDLPVLAADEDERLPGADRDRRDRNSLDQLVRVLHHQLAVLERARLGLVGVAAHVLAHVPVRQERALLSHREARAAAAAQARVLERGEQIGRVELAGRTLERCVTAVAAIALDRREPGLVDVAEEDAGLPGRALRQGRSLPAAGRGRARGRRRPAAC